MEGKTSPLLNLPRWMEVGCSDSLLHVRVHLSTNAHISALELGTFEVHLHGQNCFYFNQGLLLCFYLQTCWAL
jgi:hypothetical protein